MLKKIMKIALSLILGLSCIGFVGCTDAPGANKTIRLWGSQEDQAMLTQMVESFKKDNAALTEGVTITLGVAGENDASTMLLTDLEAGADVFAFANDQIGNLVDNSALYNLTSATQTANVKTRNTDASIKAATVDSKMYAYPSSAESYCLFYNKDIYSAEDVKTLEAMIAKEKGTAKTLLANFNDGYFAQMFFAGAGCTLYGAGGSTPDDCTWNNANGLAVAKYMKTLRAKGVDYTTERPAIVTEFTSKKTGAIITGTWNYNSVKEALGDKLGLAVLPKFTMEGKTQMQMTPFSGMKLYGVNSTTKNADVSIALADYLTTETQQLKRFNDRGFLPTNKNLATNESITAKEQIKIEVESIAISTAKPSHSKGGLYWPEGEILAPKLIDNGADVADDKLQGILDDFVAKVTGKK